MKPGEEDQLPLRILLIEDDERLARTTVSNLEASGHIVVWAADGREGLMRAFRDAVFDVVLLDLMLPDVPGLEVCRELRSHLSVPIVVLTALEGEDDVVGALGAGADEYLTKPFSLRELLARLDAIVRRAQGRAGPSAKAVRAGPLELLPRERTARLEGRTLALTTAEFNVLRALAERAGQVLTREELLTLTKGRPDALFDRSIDVTISRLRRKLGDDLHRPRLIRTVYNVGYVLVRSSG